MRFFITKSRAIKFVTGEHIGDANAPTLDKAITHVEQAYAKRGFKIKYLIMDGQFECLRNVLTGRGINLKICSEDEHVGKVERANCTVRERVRGIYTTLPYERMPGRMIIELVHSAIFGLTRFRHHRQYARP
eukprot:3992591-Ditylum_brightwellii.AAC.1